MNRIRSQLTYANVVATLALFLAVSGGAAYAVTKISKNSVGTAQIKQGAVTKQKLSKSAVNALAGKPGATGPAGPKGDTGVQGDPGSLGLTGAKGDSGATGLTGAKGGTGAAGETGPQGGTGVMGETGPQGVTGETGGRGEIGARGPQGEQGPQGDTGTVDTSAFYDKTASDARFLGTTGVAADASKLGAVDATEYGRAYTTSVGMGKGYGPADLMIVPGIAAISLGCASNGTGTIAYSRLGTRSVKVAVDDGTGGLSAQWAIGSATGIVDGTTITAAPGALKHVTMIGYGYPGVSVTYELFFGGADGDAQCPLHGTWIVAKSA